MKNLIRSKEEQIRKQEAEIARKLMRYRAVLLAETHRFYKQQPVQRVICGPAICRGGSRGVAWGGRASPLSGVKKEEMTEGRKAG